MVCGYSNKHLFFKLPNFFISSSNEVVFTFISAIILSHTKKHTDQQHRHPEETYQSVSLLILRWA